MKANFPNILYITLEKNTQISLFQKKTDTGKKIADWNFVILMSFLCDQGIHCFF